MVDRDVAQQKRKVPRQNSTSLPDSTSDAEAEARDLEKHRNEHKRDEISRRIMATGVWVLMTIAFLIASSSVFTLGWHLVMPEKLQWLDMKSLQDIKNFVLSGAVVGLATSFLRKFIN